MRKLRYNPKWLISGKAGIQVQVTALPMMPCVIRSPSHPPGPSWEALAPSRGRRETGKKGRMRKGRDSGKGRISSGGAHSTASVIQQGPSPHCFMGAWWVKWQDPRDLSLVLHKLRSLYCVRKWKLQPPRLLSSTHADSQNLLPPGGAQGRLCH